MAKNKFIRGFFFLLCIAAFVLIVGWVVMSLWNWLIPSLFQGPQINFWQALGIFLLGKILFGGFKGWGGRCCGGGHHGKHGFWRRRFEEKFATMSEEEKLKFKERYKKCCGFGEEEKTE